MSHYHPQRMHQGVEALLAFLYERFWIIGGRRLVRKVKSACIKCRKFDAKPCSEVTASLPHERVTHTTPFCERVNHTTPFCERVTYTTPFCLCGVDYAGPLVAKGKSEKCKVWIALFVCGTTRAVHLEIVISLACDNFLLVHSSFCARRGKPKQLISDNASTFKATADALNIQWNFIPPASPWFGGFYERLVKMVKAPVKKVLGQALLSITELSTVLTEVEALVHSRPLTHVGDFDDEAPLRSHTSNVYGQHLACTGHCVDIE